MNSPVVGSIKVVRSGKVKRAKLYYLRDRKGKSARIAEKIKKNIGLEVEVKPSTTQEVVQDEVLEKKGEIKTTTDKKITEKEEVKKANKPK